MSIGRVLWFVTVRAVEVAVVLLLILFMPNLPPDAKYNNVYE